jgi:hypothetical protein
MTRDRLIQLVALIVTIAATAGAGSVLPTLIDKSERHVLRYTDVSIEGAPPIVALGTAIGALRGLIVDYLWIKVHLMKERGLYYEVMHDAELITKLQPRFAAVWAFHGHNMAYNISVATHTQEERWEWVNAGIRLVRNQGLRYNPNDLQLHRELAWWFAHKIEGLSDDAHLYYKTEFAREWHYLLGEPPDDHAARTEWIKAIAEAPDTLEAAERRTPGVKALVNRLAEEMEDVRRVEHFRPTYRFLRQYGDWIAITEQSAVAQLLGMEETLRQTSPLFRAFDEIARDPEFAEAWETLLRFIRKRVLIDEYNMDPQLMYEFTRDLGPIDWRNAQAHALYWSRRGSLIAERRVLREDDIYKVLNNDRTQIQAMQGLARWGRMTFDPFSSELPSRFPESRWIETIDEMFHELYVKHYEVRGAGGETFIAFLQNFMGSAIRELYRSGEWDEAKKLMARMDEIFGTGQMGGAVGANPVYSLPLDVFVREQVQAEYSYQPHLAPSEVAAALRRGIRVGVLNDRKDIFDQSLIFADRVIEYFKGNEYYNFVNRFGRGRMNELIAELEGSLETAFEQLMRDPTIPLQERLTIWRQIDRFNPQLRHRVYDRVRPHIERQFAMNPLARSFELAHVFPEPPGMAAYRAELARQRAERERQLQEQREREDIQRR